MLVLVIGPSGVGKSTLLPRAAAAVGELPILDLDAEDLASHTYDWNPGWEHRRWLRDRERLEAAQASAPNGAVLVDVGAGTIHSPEGRAFVLAHRQHTVALIAPWETVLRRRHIGRDPQEFKRTEFSPERQSLYDAAAVKIDTGGLSEDESVGALVAGIRSVLGTAPPNNELQRTRPAQAMEPRR